MINPELTLNQGLDIFHKENSKYFTTNDLSSTGDKFLKCHDIAHVVFGCDTSIYGEGVVKLWTTFGTNLGFWNVIKAYREVRALDLVRNYSFGHVCKNIFRLMFAIPKTLILVNKMSKPWPFKTYERYLDKTILEIRSEFNIITLD